MKIILGTRGSNLAVVQSTTIKTMLEKTHPGLEVELRIIKTSGDRILDRPIHEVGKGVFVKEIEQALLNKEIDLAVHSMKDMPSELPPGLRFAPSPLGEDPRDTLVMDHKISSLRELDGKVLGTGSLRRSMQLEDLLPTITCSPIRGNIETRMGKVEEGLVDGVILARAGLARTGHTANISYTFSVEELLPAPCQGILALEIREDDELIYDLLTPIADEKTNLRMETERAFQRELDAMCHSPLGVYAIIDDDEVRIKGCYGDPERGLLVRREVTGALEDRIALAEQLARALKEALQ